MFAKSMRCAVLGLGLVALQAMAQPVAYTFSSGPSTTSMIPELLGSSVSGSFLYDAGAPLTSNTPPTANPANASIYGPFFLPAGAGIHSSYTALGATVSGGSLGAPFSFSDPRGSAIVSNGGFVYHRHRAARRHAGALLRAGLRRRDGR